ncbi:MAG: DNA repair protein RecO [Dehalococcoidia bacterium]|nr:DNA repair protein RecO [Dehalococcoidia bacterium]
MGAPRSYQTQAIIIKQTKLGEVDKILTIYTPEFGKLKAVAKGVCRPGSKLGGNVEPLTHSLLMLARGRNLDIVTQSQTIDGFLVLKSDLWRMACGLYVLELIDSFTLENSGNHPLFDLLLDTLQRLCQGDDSETVLRYFELHLLDYLGYRPQLHRCVGCNSPIKPVVNFFSSSQGGILCSHCGQKEPDSRPLSVGALKILRLWQSFDYATARRVKVRSELRSELEQVMPGYIKYLLQREVKSIAWLRELRKESIVDNNCGRN